MYARSHICNFRSHICNFRSHICNFRSHICNGRSMERPYIIMMKSALRAACISVPIFVISVPWNGHRRKHIPA